MRLPIACSILYNNFTFIFIHFYADIKFNQSINQSINQNSRVPRPGFEPSPLTSEASVLSLVHLFPTATRVHVNWTRMIESSSSFSIVQCRPFCGELDELFIALGIPLASDQGEQSITRLKYEALACRGWWLITVCSCFNFIQSASNMPTKCRSRFTWLILTLTPVSEDVYIVIVDMIYSYTQLPLASPIGL